MRPLIIRATLTEPICYYGDGMHLDGILAMAAYKDLSHEIRDRLPAPGATDWAEDFDLPLARWTMEPQQNGIDDRLLDADGMLWGWRASAVCADWLRDSAIEIRRRTPVEAHTRYSTTTRADTGSGMTKAYNLRLPTRFARELLWFCVGDPSEIQRLLITHLFAVGKHWNTGSGAVSGWTVEETPDDYSLERDGMLMRRMPAEYADGHEDLVMGQRTYGSIRPPYAHHSRRMLIVDPIYDALTPGGIADADCSP